LSWGVVAFPRSAAGSALASRDTLSQKVYKALKTDIIRGVFQPGDALTEKLLAKRYKGSRTPIREAAVRLQQERLLRIVPNRGYFVTQITMQDLNELYEYRTAVECACAELAAGKDLDPRLMDTLNRLAQTPYDTNDRASCMSFIEADTLFHVCIARLSRNQMLVRAVTDARYQMERVMYAALDIGYYGELPVSEHRDILQAIERRDPESARKHMQAHIMQSKDKVVRLASTSYHPV
jgi:DNA-binding GntR family transcriptional regulator